MEIFNGRPAIPRARTVSETLLGASLIQMSGGAPWSTHNRLARPGALRSSHSRTYSIDERGHNEYVVSHW